MATNKALTAVENQIPDISSLVKKTDLNAKLTDIEDKIPSITGLAINSGLTAVENKIPYVSSLVTNHESLIMIMINTLLLQNLNDKILMEKLLQIKQSICWSEMN